jgi:phospholipid/cholesterol/gamma-HCH transport system substrate-binding protein
MSGGGSERRRAMGFGSQERWVGVFFLLGIVLLVIMAMRVDDEGHIFTAQYPRQYTTVMPDIGSVGKGSRVLLANTGIRIGRVDSVAMVEGKEGYLYKLTFSVKDEVNGLEVVVKEDATAQLAMTTLLQGMHVEIDPGTPDALDLPSGGEIKAVPSADIMNAIAKVGDVLEGVKDGGLGRMALGAEGFEKIGKILDTLAQDGGLGRWVLGEKAQKELEPTIAELRKTVENVRKGTEGKGTVARLLHDDELGASVGEIVTDLKASMKGVRKFASDISEGKGTIARLASDEKLGEKVDGIVTDLGEVAADLRGGKSVLSRLIMDEAMGERLDEAVTGIAEFATSLARGEGTIARLVNDPELYVEAKKLVGQAREAVEDAREAAPISAFTSILFGAIQ